VGDKAVQDKIDEIRVLTLEFLILKVNPSLAALTTGH
jgi:hypothetical protein